MLDHHYSGLVVAVDARIHTKIQRCHPSTSELPKCSISDDIDLISTLPVTVVSSQLQSSSSYLLTVGLQKDTHVPFIGLSPSSLIQCFSRNMYVESAIVYTVYASLAIKLLHARQSSSCAASSYERARVITRDFFNSVTEGKDGTSVKISIFADNHFYSQQENLKALL